MNKTRDWKNSQNCTVWRTAAVQEADIRSCDGHRRYKVRENFGSYPKGMKRANSSRSKVKKITFAPWPGQAQFRHPCTACMPTDQRHRCQRSLRPVARKVASCRGASVQLNSCGEVLPRNHLLRCTVRLVEEWVLALCVIFLLGPCSMNSRTPI